MLSQNPRIVYVDDNRDSLEIVDMLLRLDDDSYQVSTFSAADKVLALPESQPIDLYILDYALPEMTGAELCRRIRQTDSRTPILFYSAMARDIDREKAKAAGATEYLVKPSDLEKLAETVRRLLHKNSYADCKSPVGIGEYIESRKH